MAYTATSFSFGEQPSAAKWNQLGSNDASFNNGTGIANLATSVTSISNPYKFFAYLTATANLAASATKIPFDTELYDTNNNFDSTTNRRYTAPVTGFYYFQATAMVNALSDQSAVIYLYKNGVQQNVSNFYASGTSDLTTSVTLVLSLIAGDYMEVFVANTQGTRNWLGLTGTGFLSTYFQGHLVSHT